MDNITEATFTLKMPVYGDGGGGDVEVVYDGDALSFTVPGVPAGVAVDLANTLLQAIRGALNVEHPRPPTTYTSPHAYR